ncbi:MAG: PorT family protein, partial [Bacteroidales bacterium]|nr:PorT family protein [Bacteroidales bacterium]
WLFVVFGPFQFVFTQENDLSKYLLLDTKSVIISCESNMNKSLQATDKTEINALGAFLSENIFSGYDCLVFSEFHEEEGSSYLPVASYLEYLRDHAEQNDIGEMKLKVTGHDLPVEKFTGVRDTLFYKFYLDKKQLVNGTENIEKLNFYFMVTHTGTSTTTPRILGVTMREEPRPPANMSFELDPLSNRLKLSWEKVDHPLVRYRVTQLYNNGETTVVGETKGNFLLVDPPEQSYVEYQMELEDVTGWTSEKSERFSFDFQYSVASEPERTKVNEVKKDDDRSPLVETETEIVSPPEIKLIKSSGKNRVSIEWQSGNNNTSLYKVYRSVNYPGNLRSVSGNINGNDFQDKNVEWGNEYYYAIKRIDKSSGMMSEYSKVEVYRSEFSRSGFWVQGLFNPVVSRFENKNFDDDEQITRIDPKTRINWGFRINYYFNENIGIRTGVEENYYRLETLMNDFSIVYHLNYLAIPFSVDIIFGEPKEINFYVEPGIKYLNLLNNSVDSNKEALYYTEWSSLADYNISATFSSGIAWSAFENKTWQTKAGITLDYGLINIGELQNSDDTYDIEAESRTIAVGVIFSFLLRL